MSRDEDETTTTTRRTAMKTGGPQWALRHLGW